MRAKPQCPRGIVGRRAKASASSRRPRVEMYTDKRIAEFLLTNTADAPDYARARKLVRKMGLEPDKVDHDKPGDFLRLHETET
jgi:hypothetical protein